MPHTLPTAATSAILFLDLQDEIVKNSKTRDAKLVIAHAGVLARLAALHEIPAFLSSVPPGGPFASGITEPLKATPRPRLQTTAFADAELVSLLAQSGRRTLILAGVASEIVVQRTALDALAAGYEVLVAVDACGGVDPRTEHAAFERIQSHGGELTSVTTFGAEIAGDFSTELGGKTLGLVYETLGG
jgi:nicotinamidase-related amidase